MFIIQILLFPFAALYNIVLGIRNRMYDQGLKPSVRFDIPVIGVGNLTVGGTGKTPLTEYLIRSLGKGHKLATLSRGYGRRTKGFRLASKTEDATTIGDEPWQLYGKFGGHVVVAVGEERALAIPHILQEHPDVQLILMDDAFQHRRVVPSLNVLLSNFNRPFYNDYVMPLGRLRESRNGARRADVVVVTKCPPTLTDDAMMEIEREIREYVEKPVFFSYTRYGNPTPISTTAQSIGDTVALLSGIADPGPLKQYVTQRYKLLKHFDFADHHHYTLADIRKLVQFAKDNPSASILTTEKDKAKLESPDFDQLIATLPVFVLPIELDFIKSGRDFDALILNSIQGDG